MTIRSLIGIKNPDGSIEMAFCLNNKYPSHQIPILTKNYGSEKAAKKLLFDGFFMRRRVFPSIHALEKELATDPSLSSIEYFCVWADNTWLCATRHEDSILPLNEKSERFEPCDKQAWMEKYFLTPSPRKMPILSQKDWLQANCPGMTSLPAWKLPQGCRV